MSSHLDEVDRNDFENDDEEEDDEYWDDVRHAYGEDHL